MNLLSRRSRARLAAPVLALGLCTGSAHAATLTLGIVDLPNNAPLLIAENEGFFAAEGLTLKIIHCANGRRCVQHFVDGEAQMVMSAETAMVFAAHAGVRYDIVATVSRSGPGVRLIARRDRGIRSAADLKGRRLGYLKSTNAHYYADTFLLLSGIDGASVPRVPLELADPTGPLTRGDIDAAALYQPHAGKALAALGDNAVVLPLPRVYTVTMNLISLPADRGVSDEDLARVLRAVQRAQRLLTAEPARMKAWLSQRLQIEPAVFALAFEELRFGLGLDQSLVQTLESQSRWAQREGLVPATGLPDYLGRVRSAPLRAVDRRAAAIVQ